MFKSVILLSPLVGSMFCSKSMLPWHDLRGLTLVHSYVLQRELHCSAKDAASEPATTRADARDAIKAPLGRRRGGGALHFLPSSY